MKTKLMVLFLLAAGALSAQISVGIRIGAPPPVRVTRMVRNPGQGYTWIAGYWYPMGGKYRWHDGYWTRPPYEGARWVEPNYDRGEYFEGRWTGDRRDFNHDHRWDRDRDRRRDYDRERERR